ncbi:DUF6090 family protein [Hyunsoonleella aestuarii]|uniref:Uncharacterized protein n=1 Tax=Hyunsoonleella aestuarii TaxID=912802 RepID=A0ABP8E7D3_9FLAO|nr:DUF6090 family protein [Hyunsoonleella aestuarii]
MIKFFRNIRKKLLNEGSTSKYFKYAIGEIILVVIGILIALQINNWNQTRLDKNLEKTMLKEIKSALVQDLENVEMIKARISRKAEGIQELLSMIASKKPYPDSTLLKTYNKMSLGYTVTLNKGAYEGLKSIGLDKISNDSLRKELILIYELYFPTFEHFFKESDEDTRNKDYKLQLHNKLWKRIQIQMPNKNYKIVSSPINSTEFLKQEELLDRIKIAQDNLNYTNFRIPGLEMIIKGGINIIDKELGKRLQN